MALVDADARTVPDGRQAVGTDPVHEQHTGVGQHPRTEVGVAPGDHRRGVEDRHDPGVDKRLRGRAVHVEVVEDGHVTGAQPGQQAACPAFDSGSAQQAGRGDRGRCRAESFMTDSSSQPGGGRAGNRGPRARRWLMCPTSAQGPGGLRDLQQLARIGRAVSESVRPASSRSSRSRSSVSTGSPDPC